VGGGTVFLIHTAPREFCSEGHKGEMCVYVQLKLPSRTTKIKIAVQIFPYGHTIIL
jgi:hypothetical protein